jgi:hypothetical protein
MADEQDLDGFTVLGEEAWGNTWCFKGCPMVEIEYMSDDPSLGPAEASASTSTWNGEHPARVRSPEGAALMSQPGVVPLEDYA